MSGQWIDFTTSDVFFYYNRRLNGLQFQPARWHSPLFFETPDLTAEYVLELALPLLWNAHFLLWTFPIYLRLTAFCEPTEKMRWQIPSIWKWCLGPAVSTSWLLANVRTFTYCSSVKEWCVYTTPTGHLQCQIKWHSVSLHKCVLASNI